MIPSRLLIAGSVAAAGLLLAACGGTAAEDASSLPTPTRSLDAGKVTPDHPPAQSLVAAAKKEGNLLMYGNANDDMVQPLVKAFEKKYAGIKVQYLSLDGAEVFQRYLSESATGTRSADALIESSGIRWLSLVGKKEVVDYQDPNAALASKEAKLAPGVTALGMGSVVAVFNRKLIPDDQQPDSLAGLADLASKYCGRIGTYEIENSLGYAATKAYVDKGGAGAWKTLAKLGRCTKPEASAGAMMDKVQQGAYVAAYNVSDAVVPLLVQPNADLFSARYLRDDTVILPQAIGITKAASSPNAAKLFLNYVFSNEAQDTECKAGWGTTRTGHPCAFSLAGIESQVGKQNVIFSGYSPALAEQQRPITARWNGLFKR